MKTEKVMKNLKKVIKEAFPDFSDEVIDTIINRTLGDFKSNEVSQIEATRIIFAVGVNLGILLGKTIKEGEENDNAS